MDIDCIGLFIAQCANVMPNTTLDIRDCAKRRFTNSGWENAGYTIRLPGRRSYCLRRQSLATFAWSPFHFVFDLGKCVKNDRHQAPFSALIGNANFIEFTTDFSMERFGLPDRQNL